MSNPKRFLVKHNAVIGRTKEDGGLHTTVNLAFYTMVEAANLEAANDLVVQYSDPGFVTKIENVVEVADHISSDDLYALLKHGDVLQEVRG